MKPSLHDIAAAAKLIMPAAVYKGVVIGDPYDDHSWTTGINGTAYDPERYGCDWLIRFAREAGYKPTLNEMKRIETLMRELMRDAHAMLAEQAVRDYLRAIHQRGEEIVKHFEEIAESLDDIGP